MSHAADILTQPGQANPSKYHLYQGATCLKRYGNEKINQEEKGRVQIQSECTNVCVCVFNIQQCKLSKTKWEEGGLLSQRCSNN